VQSRFHNIAFGNRGQTKSVLRQLAYGKTLEVHPKKEQGIIRVVLNVSMSIVWRKR